MKNLGLFIFTIMLVANSVEAQYRFPLQISENKRYFKDANGKPFLYNADTGWQIFTQLTTPEAIEYLAFRKNQGFNTIQVQLVMSPEQVNRYGHKPFLGNNDSARPDEAYYDHVAEIIAKADSLGLLIVMSQPWLGCCQEGFGGRPDKPFLANGPEKSRKYGEYLGNKFAGFNNLFWIMGGDNDPKGDRISLVAFFDGLRKTAPKHQLMTYHASPPHSSTDLFQYADWLGFSFIYTYWREKPNEWVTSDLQPHVYEAALMEWSKSDTMPFVLGESQYEGSGKIENDMGTPHIIRRQAYWTMLCGGAGHAYGSDLWNFPSNWRKIMDYPGAWQLKHFREFFETIPWWTLVPDVKHLAVVAGFGEWTKNDFITTAVSADRRLLVSYLPEIQPVTVDFATLAGEKFSIKWYDPKNGSLLKQTTLSERKVKKLNTPTGEDFILVIESI
jgi:hypothetical protein